MNIQQKGLILLIKCALNNEKGSLPDGFNFENAVKLAKKHQIFVLLYYGAINCGINPMIPEMQKLFDQVCKHMVYSNGQLYRIDMITKAFEENGIDYMLLKGSLLKGKYPKPEMRAMSDADILIKYDLYDPLIKNTMKEIGFKEERETDHELVWSSPELCVELHKKLMHSYNKDYHNYFGDGWQLAKIKVKGTNFGYAMTAEDQFLYNFTHFAKHYRNGGIGIKYMVDLFICRTELKSLNNSYIDNGLKKLRLFEFYKNIMKTLDVWFEGAEPDDKTELITDYIFESGAYGNSENKTIAEGVKIVKTDGVSTEKARHIRIRNMVFLPYSGMCIKYPVVKRFPFLLPVFWIVRGCESFYKRNKFKNFVYEVKETTTEKMDNYIERLNFVGLEFDFKE